MDATHTTVREESVWPSVYSGTYNLGPSEKRTASLEGQSKIIISHSNYTFLDLREEDNLSIMDERAGPNVSFTRRFHCTLLYDI